LCDKIFERNKNCKKIFVGIQKFYFYAMKSKICVKHDPHINVFGRAKSGKIEIFTKKAKAFVELFLDFEFSDTDLSLSQKHSS